MNIVLAIDDDPTVLKLLESQLYQMKYRVFTELSARKGVDTAKSLNPDVILLDLNMPVLSGFQVMELLSKDPITQSIPVIVLTSIGDRETVQNAVRFGIVDYVVKPHDHIKLGEKINSAIRYNRLKREERSSEESESILISHSPDTVMLSFKSPPGSRDFMNEARKVFTPFFFKQNAKRNIVIDLRPLYEFQEADIKVTEAITLIFGERQVNIVAGRHYGTIVEYSDMPPNTNLFISFGDMELFINKQKMESLRNNP